MSRAVTGSIGRTFEIRAASTGRLYGWITNLPPGYVWTSAEGHPVEMPRFVDIYAEAIPPWAGGLKSVAAREIELNKELPRGWPHRVPSMRNFIGQFWKPQW